VLNLPDMKNLRAIVLFVFGLGFLVTAALFTLGFLKPKEAGVLIESTPASMVFINGEQIGRTPYEITRPPGEITVKLVPEATDKPMAPFETKVTLTPGIKTIIRREFGDSEETSSGEIISFEKIGGKEAELALVSVPNSAQISIDGRIKGYAPVKPPIAPGEHQIVVSAPNYKERALSIKTLVGYKLTAVVKLAPSGETPKEEETPPQQQETLVEILSTPTGTLRVRDKPGLGGAEIGQVKPGERYRFLEEDEATGWFKIEYQKGKEGWVSNQYAKKVEGVLSPTPTPTPKGT